MHFFLLIYTALGVLLLLLCLFLILAAFHFYLTMRRISKLSQKLDQLSEFHFWSKLFRKFIKTK